MPPILSLSHVYDNTIEVALKDGSKFSITDNNVVSIEERFIGDNFQDGYLKVTCKDKHEDNLGDKCMFCTRNTCGDEYKILVPISSVSWIKRTK